MVSVALQHSATGITRSTGIVHTSSKARLTSLVASYDLETEQIYSQRKR